MLIILSLLILANCWQLAFNGFDERKLKATRGVLVEMPVYHKAAKSSEWIFRLKLNSEKYVLPNYNTCGVHQKEIWKMHANDSVTLFCYTDISIRSFADFMNEETTIYGIYWKDKHFLYPERIRDRLIEVKLTALFFLLFLSMAAIGSWAIEKPVKNLWED